MSNLLNPHRFGVAFDPVNDVGWYRAYWAEGDDFDAEGYSDGNDVTVWPDEISTDDMDDTTNSVPPSYDADGMNGHPSIHFDGTEELEETTATALTQPYSVVFIAQHATGSVSGDEDVVRAASSVVRADNAATDTWQLQGGGGSIGSTALGSGIVLVVAYFNGGSSAIEVNGTEDTGSTGTNSWANTEVGRQEYNGDLAFVATYDGDARDDANWADFEQWVEDHYGITIA